MGRRRGREPIGQAPTAAPAGASAREFPLAGLIERSGVPQSTINHYTKLGLLPPPRRVPGHRSRYSEHHVRILRLIRLLRERRGLSLQDIGRILPDLLGLDQMEAFRPGMWDEVLRQRADKRTTGPRERLLRVAVQAFSARGYGDVSVDELCLAADLAKGSFYRLFASKEDLFFAAADAAVQAVVQAFADGGPPVSPEEGVGRLAARLRPILPLLLELMARALQKRPGHARVAVRVFDEFVLALGASLGSPRPVEAGTALLEQAAVAVCGQVLELTEPPEKGPAAPRREPRARPRRARTAGTASP